MLRYRPWKYTKYSPRALPCLTQFFLGKKWKRLMEEAPEPERFPFPVAPLVCIFFGVHFPKSRPDPILLPESFCLPLRLRKARPLSGHSSGPYSLFSPVFVQAAQEAAVLLRRFCILSVVSPLFAVKCFLRRKHAAHGLPCKGRWLSRLRRSRRGLPSVKADPLHTGQTGGGRWFQCPSSAPRL